MIARFKAWFVGVRLRCAELRAQAAEKAYRRNYTQQYGMNLRCPHCNTWSHETRQPPRVQECGHPVAVRYVCNKCPWPSYWVFEAGFWFPSEEFGISPEEAEGQEHGQSTRDC